MGSYYFTHSAGKSQGAGGLSRLYAHKIPDFSTYSGGKDGGWWMLVGVWERDEGIGATVEAGIAKLGVELLTGAHPAELAARSLDLLAVSPGARGWAGAGSISCRAALLPGGVGALARHLRVEQAVSYGTSPRDSITFSSLEGGRLCLALQRELLTLSGGVVEQQELILPCPVWDSPLPALAAAGVLLLAGVPPEELPALFRRPTL